MKGRGSKEKEEGRGQTQKGRVLGRKEQGPVLYKTGTVSAGVAYRRIIGDLERARPDSVRY